MRGFAASAHYFRGVMAAESGSVFSSTDGVTASQYTYANPYPGGRRGDWVNSVYNVRSDGENVEFGWFWSSSYTQPIVFMACYRPISGHWENLFDGRLLILGQFPMMRREVDPTRERVLALILRAAAPQ